MSTLYAEWSLHNLADAISMTRRFARPEMLVIRREAGGHLSAPKQTIKDPNGIEQMS